MIDHTLPLSDDMKKFITCEAEIVQYAYDQFPKEMCGVIKDGKFIPLENVHETPTTGFTIDTAEFVNLLPFDLLVHSHTNGVQYPSRVDMEQQQAMAVPWAVVVFNNDKELVDAFCFGEDDIPSLIGRVYRFGVADCFTVIRDYYRLNRGIILRDEPRDWGWDDRNEPAYENGLRSVNLPLKIFTSNDSFNPAIGDVCFMKIRSSVVDHAGVYVGAGQILHHPTPGQPYSLQSLSRREPLTRWKKYVTHWIRIAKD